MDDQDDDFWSTYVATTPQEDTFYRPPRIGKWFWLSIAVLIMLWAINSAIDH